MPKFLKKYFYATMIAAFCAATPAQSTTVIDFNGTAPEATQIFAGSIYNEDGYTLQISGDAHFNDNDLGFPGLLGYDDDALGFDTDSTSFIVTKDDNGLFDLLSVVTGSLGRPGSGDNGDFIFTGYFGTTEVASLLVQALGIGVNPATTIFSGFSGLTSLVVTTTDGKYPSLDDLTVSAVSQVPVPAALPLFGTGLAALGFISWRRKRKAAA